MNMQEIRTFIKEEVPHIMQTDEEIRRFIEELGRERFADKDESGTRFDRMMDELAEQRRQSDIRWKAMQDELAEQRRELAEQRCQSDIRWNAMQEELAEQRRELAEQRRQSDIRWETQRKESQERWEAHRKESNERWEKRHKELMVEVKRMLDGSVGAVSKGAGAKILMLSLDGTLRYLPIAALHDGNAYVAENYKVIIFTEAARDKIRDKPVPEWRVAGLGLSRAFPEQKLRALPAVPEELEGIVRKDGNDRDGVLPGIVRMDQDFDYKAVRRILRRKYPVLHIASHFVFKPANEITSYLVLGDGSPLTLLQMKNELRFNGTDMMTLSACNTAMAGAGTTGREIEGFGVLAQNQGAKAVLATLWPVMDRSTGIFMQNLYRLRHEKKLTKAAALQHIPHEGRSVRLAYRHENCGEAITKETVVSYDPGRCDSPGWLMGFLSDIWKKIRRRPHTPGRVASRGESPAARISVCPTEGTTALYGGPILFKWGDRSDNLQHPKAKLVIREVGEKRDKPLVSRLMTAGEFLHADYKFQAGASYKWYVEAGGKAISDVCHFSILEKQASDNIRSQLRQVGENTQPNALV